MLDIMRDHLIDIGRPGGIFEDTHTGVRWGGRQRRCRLVLYRRFEAGEYRDADIPEIGGRRPIRELDELARNLAHGLDAAGIASRRIGAGEYTNWLMPWLTPRKNRRDAWDWLAEYGEEPDHVYPVTWDLAWGVMNHMPISDTEFGTWNFCGFPHRYLPVTGFLREPRPGLLTLEGSAGRGRAAAFFDRLPPATVFCQQVIFVPQDQVAAHLRFIERRSLSDSAESRLARTQVEECQAAMARGHPMFPMTMGFYLRGENLEELNDRLDRVYSLCKEQGLDPVPPDSCVFPLDEYVRNLPVGWHPDYDRYLYRQRYDWLMNAVAASPLWGKGGGSGRPGFTFFDRAGQPVQLDILHPEDRDRAPHCLIVGPTGTGKSALLNYLALQVMALRRPCLTIVDVGDSFRLLGDYLASRGLKVNHIRLDRTDIALPPFSSSPRMLAEQVDQGASLVSLDSLDTLGDGDAADLPEEEVRDDASTDVRRDYLGEMEAAARMIITGCDPREESLYTREDRALVRAALVDTARDAREKGEVHASVSGFVDMLNQYAHGRDPWGFSTALGQAARDRLQQLHNQAKLFIDGIRGNLFDRPGEPWPEADCTIVDFGRLAEGEDERDILAIAFIGLMNTVQREAERRRDRGGGRDSVVMIDEAHVTTTNPLLAGYLVRGSKMWRKWGLWLWMATQSLADFPEETRQMLNMAEFWFCLSMPREEIAEIARFRRLSEEDRLLLEEARKSPRRYSEGVLLSGRPPILFRNVPPAIAMALAQTEASEVAERRRLMQENGLTTELEAVDLIAEQIRERRLS
ncbi:MAG: conjugative transfer ATPase [Gammaproteobacteria bacterium]|nr:conjugative transfer ATPase [Gammaproteobacteria bacterium]